MSESLVRLLDTVVVCRPETPQSPTLLIHGPRMLRIRGTSRATDDVLERLGLGIDEEEIAPGRAAKDVRSLMDTLAGLGWLTREPAHSETGATWDRQVGWWTTLTPDGQAAQRRLGDARVAVLGLGGIGGLVLQHLVSGGVRRLWLVDHDTVAPHNLNRQYLYRKADIGTPKTAAATAALRGIADELDLYEFRLEVRCAEDLEVLSDPLDLLIVAADTPADLMDHVWVWALRHGVPVVAAGVGLDTGYWGPLLDPRQGHCWFCFEDERLMRLSEDERRLEAQRKPTPYSFGPTNAIIADHLARDAMLFLALGRCSSLGQRQVMNVLGVDLELPLKAPAPTPETGVPTASGRVPGCRKHGRISA